MAAPRQTFNNPIVIDSSVLTLGSDAIAVYATIYFFSSTRANWKIKDIEEFLNLPSWRVSDAITALRDFGFVN